MITSWRAIGPIVVLLTLCLAGCQQPAADRLDIGVEAGEWYERSRVGGQCSNLLCRRF